MSRKFYKENSGSIPAISYSLSQPTGYTEVTDNDELKLLYIGMYKDRENDGMDLFEDFRAGLMISIINGLNVVADVVALELHLKILQKELMEGNWLTAQNYINTLTLSGIYDQAMKDELKTIIDDYINNNY